MIFFCTNRLLGSDQELGMPPKSLGLSNSCTCSGAIQLGSRP